MMFMLPMLGAMALPYISWCGVAFGFVPHYLAHVLRPIRPLGMRLPFSFSAGLVCPLLPVGALFAPFLLPIRLVSVRVLLGRGASVFLAMLVPLLLLRACLPVLVAGLCTGKGCCS